MRILSFMLLMTSPFVIAQNAPLSFPSDARIKHVRYQDNNVIPIHGTPLTTTQILLDEQEQILDIEGGDSAAWMVIFHPNLPNMMFVKPTLFDAESNMTVITNRRPYYFHLSSHKQTHDNTYAIKIDYPIETKSVKNNPVLPPKAMNRDYRFSGNPQLVPLHMFDDGLFTYFELAANAPIPAIFAIDDPKGQEHTVNSRREGKYIVVQRTAPQFTLRSGNQVTSVFNTQEIHRIQQQRRPQ